MSLQRLLPVTGTYAELDLGTVATQLDTVIRAVTDGPTLITIAAVADSAAAENVTFEVDGTDIICHFEDGVSTVADFEAAIAADAEVAALIAVETAGTGAAVLAVADDDFAATPLTGGGATSSAAPSDLTDSSLGKRINADGPCDQCLILVRSVDAATSITKTATVTMWGFHEELGHWFVLGTLNDGEAIAETSADAINYAELLVGLRRISHLYAQVVLAGTGHEVAVHADPVRATTGSRS